MGVGGGGGEKKKELVFNYKKGFASPPFGRRAREGKKGKKGGKRNRLMPNFGEKKPCSTTGKGREGEGDRVSSSFLLTGVGREANDFSTSQVKVRG